MIFPLSSRIASHSSLRARTSKPSVGSSRKRIFGSLIRAIAMLSLRCQPPESLPAFFVITDVSRNCTESSSVLAFVFSFPKPCTPHMSSKFSLTDRFGATAVSCGETPIRLLTPLVSVFMLFPFKNASPPSGLVRHVSIFIVVVLPAPFTPSNANNSPSSTSRLSSSTAVRSLYLFVRFLISIDFILCPPCNDISIPDKRR